MLIVPQLAKEHGPMNASVILGSNQVESHKDLTVLYVGSSKKVLVNVMKRVLTMNPKVSFLLPLLLFVGASTAIAQVGPAATGGGSRMGTFVSFGGLRTHVINYTYNALGIEGGAFLQGSPLVGIEVRAGSYPLYARYSQTPITAGWRVEAFQPGIPAMRISAYIGGGMSRAQDAGPHYVPLPAEWSPCWQASQSITFGRGSLSLKPVEATFTRTYTPQRTLQGFSLTTGLTYRFSLHGSRP